MATNASSREVAGEASLFASRLAYHLRCLREDATDPDLSSVDRLAVVRERAVRIREIRRALEHPRATRPYLTAERIRRNVNSTA